VAEAFSLRLASVAARSAAAAASAEYDEEGIPGDGVGGGGGTAPDPLASSSAPEDAVAVTIADSDQGAGRNRRPAAESRSGPWRDHLARTGAHPPCPAGAGDGWGIGVTGRTPPSVGPTPTVVATAAAAASSSLPSRNAAAAAAAAPYFAPLPSAARHDCGARQQHVDGRPRLRLILSGGHVRGADGGGKRFPGPPPKKPPLSHRLVPPTRRWQVRD